MEGRLPSRTNAAGAAESKMKRLYEADVQLLSAIADTARKKEMECSMAGCQVQTQTCMCLCIHLSRCISTCLPIQILFTHCIYPSSIYPHRVKGLGGVRQRQVVSGQYRRVYPRTARLHCAWHKRISLSLASRFLPPSLYLYLSHIHKYRCVLCMSPMARTASVAVPPCGMHHHRVHAACLKAANQCATLPEKAACPLCRRTHKAGSVCHASMTRPAMFPASRSGGSVAPSPGRPSR